MSKAADTPLEAKRRRRSALVFLALRFAAALISFAIGQSVAHQPVAAVPTAPLNLSDLLRVQPERLAEVKIARMNLLCAQGLPGAEHLDINDSLASLGRMADRVRSETERHLYRFKKDPSEFENSEGFFRMLMLVVVLAEDFQVHYAPDKMGSVTDSRPGDGFFANAEDVFVHGLIGPRHQGTCSSLPVLYVAVGRQLGYPLKLVTTRGHLFVRWEDSRERFNVEATGHAVNRFPDDYYRHWPVTVSDDEVQAEGYLKSLNASSELAAFLSIRGMCLREARRYPEAADAFAAAARLAPECRSYRALANSLRQNSTLSLSATNALAPAGKP